MGGPVGTVMDVWRKKLAVWSRRVIEWGGKLREQGGVPFKNIVGVGEVGISFIVESDDERRYYIIIPRRACAASGQAIALGLEYIIICNFFLKLTFRSPF